MLILIERVRVAQVGTIGVDVDAALRVGIGFVEIDVVFERIALGEIDFLLRE